MYCLPPQRHHWRLAWLNVPATWKGGARRVKVLVDYGMMRGGVTHLSVFTRISARTDEHLKAGDQSFMPAHLISHREAGE